MRGTPVADSLNAGLSRVIAFNEGAGGQCPFRIEASEAECERLARWLDVEAVSELRAQGVMERRQGAVDLVVQGRIVVRIVQRCVVTLEPIEQHLDFAFERQYSARLRDEWGMYGAESDEIFLDLEEGPVVDPLPDGGIDVGAVVAEEMALYIDPFPRAPAVLARGEGDGNDGAGTSSGKADAGEAGARPFAGLGDRLSKRR